MNKNVKNWEIPFGKRGILTWVSDPDYPGNDRPMSVKAYFLMENGSYNKSELPWSQLTLMHLGAEYESYEPIQFKDYPIVYKFDLSQMRDCNIEKAVECIPKSLLSLKKMDDYLCYSMCFTFKIEDISFIIPCVEVARCLFGSYEFILNRLLHSGGLSNYIESETIEGNTLHFNFSEEMKKNDIKPLMLSELAWVLHTKEVYQEWENTYSEFIKKEHIIARIPYISGARLSCSGIRFANKVLVQSVQLLNRQLVFDEITYTHPQGNQNDNDCTDENIEDRVFMSSTDGDFDDNVYATEGNGRNIMVSIPQNTFLKIPTVRNISKVKKSTGTPLNYKGFIKSKQKSLTTNETAVSGTGRSVEINPGEKPVINSNTPEGFEKFAYTIECLRGSPYRLNPSITYYDFEGDTPICFMKNGQRRKWAFVTIPFKGKLLSIIEANITDGLSLGTLIFLSESNGAKASKHCIQKLIQDGSWHKDWFKEVTSAQIHTLKHFSNRSPKHWAELIINSF